MLKFIFFTYLINSSLFAFSNIQSQSNRCPTKFTGQVLSVKDSLQVEPFKKLDIEIKPDANNSPLLQIAIIKGGPHQLVQGKRYTFEMNGKWLCNVTSIK